MESIKGKVSFKILNGSILGLFILTILYLTAVKNSMLLWKLQDLDLFITTPRFFLESVTTIGGSSVYISSFFNQFFFYPWVGSLLYLSVLLFIAWLTSYAFNFRGEKFALSLIPSLALLLSMTELGYMIYALKSEGFVYLGAFGLISILTGLMAYRKMKGIITQCVFIFFYFLILFPFSGAYAIFGTILFLLLALKHTVARKDIKQLIPAATALISIILITSLYYQFVSYRITYPNLYLINLPSFLLNKAEWKLWLPYFFMAIFLIMASLFGNADKTEPSSSKLKSIGPIAIYLACLAGVFVFSYEDKNFNTELSMISASEKGEWNKVLELSKQNKVEPTRLIVMNAQLACYKLGLSDELYKIKEGNKAFNSPKEILPINIAGIFFYYQYGKINYCYKWCMENMVEMGMSASVMKYFVLSSILNGEYNLARKYNEVLKSTLFYKSWAMKHELFMEDPGRIADAPEFKSLVPLLSYTNSLEGDHNMLEDYLNDSFAMIQSDSSPLIELSIHTNLNMKNRPRFWQKFYQWINTHDKIPVRFQEAVLLFQHLDHKEKLDLTYFDQEVLNNYEKFKKLYRKYKGYPNESVQGIFYKQFGGTYWYYYFFTKDQSMVAENSYQQPN